MGLIRLIILGVVVWLCLRMVRKFQEAGKKPSRKQNTLKQANMVPCKYCNVHLPESRAVRHEQLWFCSEEHKHKYLTSGSQR